MDNNGGLRVGRIDYLNIWPVFESIKDDPVTEEITYVSGHPSILNRGLADGTIDMAPSSSYEYLLHAERYRLLPNLGISAENEVWSVLFCLPFSFDKLEEYVLKGGSIRLTSASAASSALLKVLWHFHWKLPPPVWKVVQPGCSLESKEPFLEIGDQALNIHLYPGNELLVMDLAGEWKKFTGLPFVFGLWIINQQAYHKNGLIIDRMNTSLQRAANNLPRLISSLAKQYPGKCFSPEIIMEYWKKIHFKLGPDHLAGLAVFGKYLTRMGLTGGMPVLDFI